MIEQVFPLKKNAITGTGDTHFDNGEYIFIQGTEALPSYMFLGVRYDPGAPAVASGKMDAYGLTLCRRINDYNQGVLHVFLNTNLNQKNTVMLHREI